MKMHGVLCRVGPGGYPRIATLGDARASTCSVRLALDYIDDGAGEVLGYASFEEAAAAVKLGGADLLLVPGAYPQIRGFMFDAALGLRDQFVGELPPIVLAAAPNAPAVESVLYLHSALQQVASDYEDITGRSLLRVEVSSNAVACQRLLEHPGRLALTNLLAADAYGVFVLATMRDAWPMPTMLFGQAVPSLGTDLRAAFEGRAARRRGAESAEAPDRK